MLSQTNLSLHTNHRNNQLDGVIFFIWIEEI
jgi:hypothetical protein